MLEALSGPPETRMLFLADLVRALGVSARGHYPEAGNAIDAAVQHLRLMNELVLVVGTQLSADLDGVGGYPDEALVSVLAEKAEDCLPDLAWAVSTVMQTVRRQSTK